MRMSVKRPSDRAASASARAARWRALGQELPPGRRRPAVREREQDDVVAAVVVAFDVQVARRLRGGGQDLERDVALDEARDVDVAAVRASQQVATPQQ